MHLANCSLLNVYLIPHNVRLQMTVFYLPSSSCFFTSFQFAASLYILTLFMTNFHELLVDFDFQIIRSKVQSTIHQT